MPKVTLNHVLKVYSDKGTRITALNGIDLQIEDRECVVLVGPAGSGKSTMLRMIAGLEEVVQGDIGIGERQVNNVAAKNRDVAMIFAGDSLYPQMTAYENIAFGLDRRRFAKAEITRRVKDVASVLALEELLGRKPNDLSLEQRQRVAFARAVARQPKLLLFDDPLARLDPITRSELRTEIARLHERLQTTMIFATANPVEAMMIGDRIVVLNNGVVQQTGTARALYDEPVNSFVARFVGDPPMNFVQGELKQGRDALNFCEAGDGSIELQISEAERPGAREFISRQILLGIRPEQIGPAEFTKWKPDNSANFPALVDRIEPLGAETNLHLQTGAHTLICRTSYPVERRQAGQRMQFKINLRRIQLFDPVSTKRIV